MRRSCAAFLREALFGGFRRACHAAPGLRTGCPCVPSPFGELELDPAVAAMADLVVAGLDGLVLAETGRHEALRRDAQVDKLQDHGECARLRQFPVRRSEGHTSELQSLVRISYAVFCLKNIKTH